MEHSLAYEAIASGKVDLVEVYSTDAKIRKLDLAVLRDDQGFFPDYSAVILARRELMSRFPKTWAALSDLEGRIDNKKMIELNARAELDGQGFTEVAAEFIGSGVQSMSRYAATGGRAWRKLWRLTREHLFLVFVSLAGAILIGVPLGVVAAKQRVLGQGVLLVSGLLQTIPSLALLCFLIPLLGIGTAPSLFALFLYGLLPIVRNTYSGLLSLDPRLLETGKVLGLTSAQRLRLIELPMASISILSGIKTSAVINVGTATLAALIGAGGYGTLIVTGLALNDVTIILQGAVPSAVMALALHATFELLDRAVIPKGLRSG